jgi:hypothetical protein
VFAATGESMTERDPTGENSMSETINRHRRRFLGTAAMSIAAAFLAQRP